MGLAAILGAEYLDDLLRAARALVGLDERDLAAIRACVHAWDDTQALANLLMLPRLLPAELRAAALLRGLQARDIPYLALAAAVGLERLDAGDFAPAERLALRDLLLDTVAGRDTLIALRAASALSGYLDADDLPRVLPLLAHPDRRVGHNLLVALAEHLPRERIDAALAEPRDLPPATAREWRKYLRATRLDAPILAHVPSLRVAGG